MYSFVDNAQSTALAPRAIGGTSLIVDLADAPEFKSPSPEAPLKVACYDQEDALITVLLATGRTANVLQISGAAEPYEDAAVEEGYKVACVPLASDFSALWTHATTTDERLDALEDAPQAEGTVTSVNLTVPAGLSVSGGPITESGTFAITTALSGLIKGAAGGFATATPGTDYVTPSGLASALDDYVLEDAFSYILMDYATNASLASYATTASLSSYATNSALSSGLAGKEPVIAAGTTSQFWRGDKTWQALPATAITGLVTAGTNVTITGSGTSGSPYVVNASGGGGSLAIGSAITSSTAGSVLIVDASGQLAQDNTGLYFDASNNRLGVGLASPAAILDVQGSGSDLLRLRNSSGTTLSGFASDGTGFPITAQFVLARGIDLTTGTNMTGLGHVAPYAGVIQKVKVQAGTNGASGGFSFTVKVNGTAIFASPQSVAASTPSVQSFTTFSNTAIAEGDTISVDVTSAGSGVQNVLVSLTFLVRNR